MPGASVSPRMAGNPNTPLTCCIAAPSRFPSHYAELNSQTEILVEGISKGVVLIVNYIGWWTRKQVKRYYLDTGVECVHKNKV